MEGYGRVRRGVIVVNWGKTQQGLFVKILSCIPLCSQIRCSFPLGIGRAPGIMRVLWPVPGKREEDKVRVTFCCFLKLLKLKKFSVPWCFILWF